MFFFEGYGDHRDLHSFPTRRSSDLLMRGVLPGGEYGVLLHEAWQIESAGEGASRRLVVPGPYYGAVQKGRDRKSTRLNSSHANISYAVFCLKKKNEDVKYFKLKYQL